MYDSKNFKDIFDSILGQEIWKYLNSEDAKLRMELTSQLGHPAAEGIGDVLLLKFGEEVGDPRVKQATGHMIRYVMETYGYQLVQMGAQCRKKKELFSRAARYSKGDTEESLV